MPDHNDKTARRKTLVDKVKGALSRYSVIFCAILLWGKIMAAVRFSIVAVLRTIRLCVEMKTLRWSDVATSAVRTLA